MRRRRRTRRSPIGCLIRAASNAYFAQTLSAISIPEPGLKLRNAVEEVWADFLQVVTSLARAGVRAQDAGRQARARRSSATMRSGPRSSVAGRVRSPLIKGIREAELETLLESPDRSGRRPARRFVLCPDHSRADPAIRS